MAAAARSLGLAVVVGLFLGAVGAFETGRVPLLVRLPIFAGIGLACGLMVGAYVMVADRIEALRTRPGLRRTAIGLMMWLSTAILVWLVIGYGFMGGPDPRLLPYTLAYAGVTSVAMTLLSWAIFRRRAPAAQPAAPEPPRFLQRLPVRLRGSEIWAVQAEDHYLRIHTSKGSDLILMRLSDAIVELDGIEGERTHRSWWVAKDALEDVARRDGRTVLKLKGGIEAPVSRSNAQALRRAGWF